MPMTNLETFIYLTNAMPLLIVLLIFLLFDD